MARCGGGRRRWTPASAAAVEGGGSPVVRWSQRAVDLDLGSISFRPARALSKRDRTCADGFAVGIAFSFFLIPFKKETAPICYKF